MFGAYTGFRIGLRRIYFGFHSVYIASTEELYRIT